ncbi:MAG TPA: hypothetical protein VFS30_04415 [Dehalococcoidia bacterium]|nr:hypothetical protein [Dehalococcoidia bacterium]
MGIRSQLDRISFDWAAFDAAGRDSRELISELAADRAALRELVLAVGRDEHLLPLCEKVRDFKYMVLYDALDRGFRLRLHRFSEGQEDEPHNHRYSFSSYILKGAYTHTLYEVADNATAPDAQPYWELHQPPGTHDGGPLPKLPMTRLSPLLTQTQAEGSSYSLHHTTFHATALPAQNAYSLFLRGPAEKPSAIFLDPANRAFRWKFGRAQERPEVLTARSFTLDDHKRFVEQLEADGVI